jgi:hypothetical protein
VAPRRRRGLAPTGKALLDDPQLRIGRPTTAPPEFDHLEPLNLRIVLMPIHKDTPHRAARYRKAAVTGGLPSSTVEKLEGRIQELRDSPTLGFTTFLDTAQINALETKAQGAAARPRSAQARIAFRRTTRYRCAVSRFSTCS